MNTRLRTKLYISCTALLLAGPLLPAPVCAQLSLPQVQDPLQRLPIDRRLEPRVRRTADDAADKAEAVPDTVAETVDEAAPAAGQAEAGAADIVEAAGAAAQQALAGVDSVLRDFGRGADPAGWPVEEDILVLLVEHSDVAALRLSGTVVVAERRLAGLGKSLLTVRRTAGVPLPEVLEELRATNPAARADYNHVYRFATGTEPATGVAAIGSDPAGAGRDTQARIGIIDSAVQAGHFSLAGIDIHSRDFVSNRGLRPETHGTAVASLIARSSADKAIVYSASVFFQAPNYAPGATTESLVAALDWLAGEQVDVINMSLSGPPNALLQQALVLLQAAGPPVVAAVGNNGPAGEPLYPAAYDDVIGVTAVDRDSRIFTYANRGEHVDFAALGVNVKVADSTTGGWRIESGTSMASPHVAVIVGQLLRAETVRRDAVMSWLMSGAEDLGRRGFDPVFGHGLVTRPPLLLSRE